MKWGLTSNSQREGSLLWVHVMHILGIFLNMDNLLLENICPKHLFWALFPQGLHQAESGVFSLRCRTRLLWIGSFLLVFAWGKLACRCCIVSIRKLLWLLDVILYQMSDARHMCALCRILHDHIWIWYLLLMWNTHQHCVAMPVQESTYPRPLTMGGNRKNMNFLNDSKIYSE
jgi:hypothetical protein